MSKEQIIDAICMTLGGRMAEELFFNKVNTIYVKFIININLNFNIY